MNATAHRERRDGDRVPCASRVMIVHGELAWFTQLLDLSEGRVARTEASRLGIEFHELQTIPPWHHAK